MKQDLIVIVDYGMGNLGSIQNMLHKIGARTVVSSDRIDIERACKLILPGVGAFDSGMRNLENFGFVPLLHKKVIEDKTPLLGICLGMQLLTKNSEEGSLPGLGWIAAKTVKFRFNEQQGNLKVPHMGWNTVKVVRKNDLFKDPEVEMRFYFSHSYYIVCDRSEDVLTTTNYGCEFASSIQKDNIFAVQFHPEKSHKFGMKVLKNFMEL